MLTVLQPLATRLTALLAALLVAVGALAVIDPAHAAPPGLEVSASPARVEVGERTVVTVVVTPASRGRTVHLQRKTDQRWVQVATGRTNARGVVRLQVSFGSPGRVPLRAVARKYRGQKQQTATTSVLVLARGGGGQPGPGPQNPPPGSDEEPFPTAGELSLQAPRWVVVGSTFDVRFPVTAGPGGITTATLKVTPPMAGERVTPPGDLTPVPGGLGTTVTALPAGQSTSPRLRWKAPRQPGRLVVAATLTVAGVQRQLSAAIQVVPELAGGQRFSGELEIWRESREAPVDPELVKDFPARVLGARPVPTFEAALAAARTFVAGRFDGSQQASWQEFLDRTAANPELVDDVLATAFGSNHAVAALAIALRGHQVAPNDPVHLSNAAVAANSLDRPEWAIAFGRKAGELPAGPSVGADQDAVRLTNVAHAWALTGSWAQAEHLLRRALLLDPQNPLIHEELAAVRQFAQGKQAALPHVRRALRKTDDLDPLEDHESNAPYRFSRVSAGEIFDLSRGLDGSIEMPEFPETPGELMAGAGWGGYYDQQEDALFARLQATQRKITETIAELRAEDLHPIARQRINDVIRHIGSDGDVAVNAAYLEVAAARSSSFGRNGCSDLWPNHIYCNYNGDNTGCGETNAIFSAWRARMATWHDAVLNYHDVAWPVFTGLQGQLSNEVAFRLAGLEAEAAILRMMYHHTRNVNDTGFAFQDVDTYEDVPCFGAAELDDPQDVDLDVSAPPFCAPDSDVSKLAFEVDLLVTKLKTSCEKFSLESSLGAYGFLEGYAKYEQSWKGNGATIYVGGKAQIPSVASFDSVVYVQTDGSGGVKDVGLEVGPEVELGGSIKLTTYSDKVRISAMSTFVRE